MQFPKQTKQRHQDQIQETRQPTNPSGQNYKLLRNKHKLLRQIDYQKYNENLLDKQMNLLIN